MHAASTGMAPGCNPYGRGRLHLTKDHISALPRSVVCECAVPTYHTCLRVSFVSSQPGVDTATAANLAGQRFSGRRWEHGMSPVIRLGQSLAIVLSDLIAILLVCFHIKTYWRFIKENKYYLTISDKKVVYYPLWLEILDVVKFNKIGVPTWFLSSTEHCMYCFCINVR